jgi:hypothetical protein
MFKKVILIFVGILICSAGIIAEHKMDSVLPFFREVTVDVRERPLPDHMIVEGGENYVVEFEIDKDVIQSYFPSAIDGTMTMKVIKANQLTAILVQAIKELTVEVDSLKARLQQLESSN